MRVAVIGAGIVGVTSAYELAADGHEVTVFERRGSVAAEASFANAGMMSPGYVTPWAEPGMPLHLARSFFGKHAAMRVNPRLSASTLKWMWRWWRARKPDAYRANHDRMHRLACYSKQRLDHLTHTLRLDYERAQGYLVLLRTERAADLAQTGLGLMTELGVRHALLDAAGCRQVEPGLHPDTPLHAGIHLASDEVGNCRQFALLMRDQAERLGAKFRFHTQVQSIEPGTTPRVVKVYSPMEESTWFNADLQRTDGPATDVLPFDPDAEPFDAVVVCAALGGAELLNTAGLSLPMAAVHGYSVTAPLRHLDSHHELGPRAGVMDDSYKVTVSRFGNRIRVAGGAELGGSPDTHHKASLETLYKVMNDWFPGAARMSQAQAWKGARPMLPDGPPVVGASNLPGIWVNLGHGSSGWALACGCARLLANALGNPSQAIEIDGLGVDRLQP